MSDLARVAVHSSAFPEQVKRDLLQSLRVRDINPKLHYISYKQSEKWLALHEAHSPARTDSDCEAVYDRSFRAAAERLKPGPVRVIGLGCGGGQKDARLLKIMSEQGREISYVACDASLALVLTSGKAAQGAAPGIDCERFVCDLATAGDLSEIFPVAANANEARLFGFFGMIPNFHPEVILPKLRALLKPADYLLFSANLAPGPDYAAGVKTILPGYDNALTREWLMVFLADLGVEAADGKMDFSIAKTESGLRRIEANYTFSRERTFRVYGEIFQFNPGGRIRLFFSYRYTPALVEAVLAGQNIEVVDQWITRPEEEGVFLCRVKKP